MPAPGTRPRERITAVARALRLTDGVVELRAPRRADTAEVYAAVRESLPELLPWMVWASADYREVEAAEWIRRAGRAFADGVEYQFVVRLVESGELLGSVGLNAFDRLNRWANLGYWIRTSRQGNGFITRAAALVTDFAFAELGLGRVEIMAAVENTRSQAVAERLGALREGVARRRLRVGEAVQDAVVFSIIP